MYWVVVVLLAVVAFLLWSLHGEVTNLRADLATSLRAQRDLTREAKEALDALHSLIHRETFRP